MCNIQNSKNTILYYPSIKIKDGAWLRNAILCLEFCEQVRRNLKQRRGSSGRRDAWQVHSDKMRISDENMVHIEKTPGSILDYLLEEGIAEKNSDGPWINMSERDANIYGNIG